MAVSPLYIGSVIVDKVGAINLYFLQRWEEVRLAFGFVAAKAIVQATTQSASIVGALILTTTIAGVYRIAFSARRTAVDGVGSTLTATIHYLDGGVPVSIPFPVNNTDTTGSVYYGSVDVPVDAISNITFDQAYTSVTPGLMKFKNLVVVSLLQVAA